jgi:hypothetical protein
MIPSTVSEMLFNDAAFARVERIAAIMASGKATIPAHLRGSHGDCFALLLQAARWKMDPYAVAQKTYIVNGVLGYEAQLIAAVINSSSAVQDRFHFDWFGDWTKAIGKFEIRKGDKGEYRTPGWKMADEESLGVRVWATLRGETEPRSLDLLLAQARTRNSTLWADDPKQQLAYLAQKRWARLYCPDVILGVYTPDELETPPERDMGTAEVVAPAASGIKDKLRQKLAKPAATSVLKRISAATTLDELNATKSDAAALPEDERALARKLFAERKAELAKEKIDTETGEIHVPDLRSDPEFADWISAIDGCSSSDELEGLVGQMPEETVTALSGYIEARRSANG